MFYVNVILVPMSSACIIYIIRRQILHKNNEISSISRSDLSEHRTARILFAIKRKTYIFAKTPGIMDKRLTDKIVRYFATQPVVKAWVFGSYARGEAHSGSDIDILVVFDKEAKVSLMKHAEISLELSEILGFDVDLITEGTLLSFAERTANNDKILIYDRARSSAS